mmetsp:Transcript_12405/g.34402  ORF Transcript_12405/g.34402 Transcript_12405/m.34402 type:complete len:1188 (-) Transcript_12405:2235-5798(-)
MTVPTPTGGSTPVVSMTQRARRRREEAVRRLVAEVQAQETLGGANANNNLDPLASSGDGDAAPSSAAALLHPETHDWLVASVTATALEKGMDRDLHAALVQESKHNAGRIGQICQDHADVFLDSVASVAGLESPAVALSGGLRQAQESLDEETAGPMLQAAILHSEATAALQRAQTLSAMVEACRETAIQLEKGRKQAAAGRPRTALQAVDKARSQLARPIQSLTQHIQASMKENGEDDDEVIDLSEVFALNPADAKKSLLETPFGKRASISLPKIENEVLMGARRNLNRWFLNMRSGGEGAMAGRSLLRQCAFNLSVGPGHLSLGGQFPTAYMWRAKTADNLMVRAHLTGKVARALRQGYWFERDAQKEADNVNTIYAPNEGLQRKAEHIASAFGWYRCWDPNDEVQIDPAEMAADDEASMRGSRHGGGSSHGPNSGGGLSGSRHGDGSGGNLSGSRHGMRGSRHGKRSLGFRASTSSKSQAFQEISSTLGSSVKKSASGAVSSKWNEVLHPAILFERSPNAKAESGILLSLPETVHPVRRAELAFSLLGRADEFFQYYEQNRFGEMKVGKDGDNKSGGANERKSYLSSLTGDDVTMGNDRIFFAKTFPHLCSSVAGFSAVEAALELGNFDEDDDKGANGAAAAGAPKKSNARQSSANSSRFRESSERYERSLTTELGSLLRSRSKKASMAHMVKASNMLQSLRSSLKIIHPSSAARRYDKDYLSLGKDCFVNFQKLAQEEQLKVTAALVMDDQKIPMLITDMFGSNKASFLAPSSGEQLQTGKNLGIPEPEEVGLPFGLSQMKQKPPTNDGKESRTTFNRASLEVEDAYTFSQSVPSVMRALHARAIATAAFALNQQELGHDFPVKPKGSDPAGFVLDCTEECVNVSAVGMKDSDNTVDEGSVEKAVQVMANITAMQHCLPRFFATLVRGMCQIGLIRGDELDETLSYSEKILKNADKSCDAQIGSTYSLVYEICRNKIDSHINFALENFNWVAKSSREMPNAYCEGLIGYLKSVFNSLGPMDEGSRAGLHFSCCGHVSERLVKLLSGKAGDTTTMDDSGIQPIARIDAFGIKNLLTDCGALEKFASSTGVPQLQDCFGELRSLTTFLLDKDLPNLILPESAAARRRKYPLLSLEKVGNILEKYVGTGLGDKLMGGATGRTVNILLIDKKEVPPLVKLIRSQEMS